MRELVTFGLVGIAATLWHYLVALGLIKLFAVDSYLANLVAWASAVAISYFGHGLLTFRTPLTKASSIKFAVVAVAAMGSSQLLFYLLKNYSWLPVEWQLMLVVAIIPVFSYLANKFWVFSAKNHASPASSEP